MEAKASYFSPSERKLEKEAARKRDERALRAGDVSARELSIRNNFFAALDMRKFKLLGIGRRSLEAS
jgi:hypothetical protein